MVAGPVNGPGVEEGSKTSLSLAGEQLLPRGQVLRAHVLAGQHAVTEARPVRHLRKKERHYTQASIKGSLESGSTSFDPYILGNFN